MDEENDIYIIFSYCTLYTCYVNAIYTHTQKYCFIVKKKEILLFVNNMNGLKGLMQSEISQTEDDEYCRVSLICGIWKKKNS